MFLPYSDRTILGSTLYFKGIVLKEGLVQSPNALLGFIVVYNQRDINLASGDT